MYTSDGSARLVETIKVHDGDADLSLDAYVAMDEDYLYLAFDVEDDIINTDNTQPSYQQDSPEFFIGLYDWRGPSHAGYQRGSEPDYHFKFGKEVGFLDTPDLVEDLFKPDSSDDYYWEEDFPTGYTVEAKVPFALLADLGGDDLFKPLNGMRMRMDIAVNDADLGLREALLALSPDNADQSWNTVSTWTYAWIGDEPVDVAQESSIVPTRYELTQNYPNPFNPTTQIKFSIMKQSNVNLKVFNILGQEVKTLVNEVKVPGVYQVDFDASELATGMYIYQLQAGDFVSAKKMLLVK
jgi:hypothetical protein